MIFVFDCDFLYYGVYSIFRCVRIHVNVLEPETADVKQRSHSDLDDDDDDDDDRKAHFTSNSCRRYKID